MSDFIGTKFSISENSNNFLTQTKLINKLSYSDSKSTIIKNNVIINIIQLNSAFYNLVSSTSPVQQNHADLYNFIYNSLNNFGLAINILIDTYIKELDLTIKSYKLIIQIQILVYLFLYILFYFIAVKLYSKIIQIKKSYIEVFININFDFISNSINKCEEFINKYKLSEDKKNQEEEIEESFDEKTNLLKSEKHYKDSNINLKGKSFNMIKNNKSKKKLVLSQNLLFKIFFGIFIIITYLFYYLYSYFYFANLNKRIKDISLFYYHLQNYHLNIIEYYNIYREYLFDSGSLILDVTPYENLIIREKKIYNNWTDDIKNITYFTNTLIDNKDIKNQLNKSICSYNITDYFQTEQDCINAIGSSYNQEISTFCYGFIDEIRIKKNIIRILLEMGIIIGNLTEYDTENWHNDYYDLFNNEKNEDLTQKIRFRLELFNDGYFHTISNIQFINVILPCLNENRKIIFDYLTIVGKQNSYYFIFALYILIMLLVYIFYWIPMISQINKVIYETKSMLKIIPMHILMADINIKNLLKINIKK